MSAVTLTWTECAVAAEIGARRRLVALKKNRSEPLGTPESDLWESDIQSSAAEFAAAIVLGKRWRMEIVNSLEEKPPDVGDDIEVRWTKHVAGHLAIYPRDHPTRLYVLVIGEIPTFSVVGTISGERGRRDDFWGKTPRGTPAWWIPQTSLDPA